MKMRHASKRSSRSGFTLIESMVAITLFAIMGYALTVAVSIGNHSQKMVLNMASEDRSLRASTMMMLQELRTARGASMAVTTLADNNSQLEFQMPVDNAGVADWGVYDGTLGATDALKNRVGWKMRYTVRDVASGNGRVDKQLVREEIDDLGAIQKLKVLVHGLRAGNVAPEGFKVVQQGAVWQVTLSTTSQGEGQAGIRTVFHVQTRN
jgi:prepilin-type N-terminal cleavage/methylation domain-containing protein